jgi:hypothetical protein
MHTDVIATERNFLMTRLTESCSCPKAYPNSLGRKSLPGRRGPRRTVAVGDVAINGTSWLTK